MKTWLFFRVTLGLILMGVITSADSAEAPIPVGSSGALRAYRVCAFLGWAFKIRNDSDTPRTAIYAINDWADLKVVPPHSTVKAGYVLGQEIPSFRFAPRY